MATMQNHPEQAASLFAWADATRTTISILRQPVEQVDIDRDLATIQTQLDKTTFTAAQTAGRTMSMDEAVAYALESTHD
jgi:cob(I)alamin adenosyltransferase